MIMRQSTKPTSTKVNPPKIWTDEGLKKLGILIKQCRIKNNLSQKALSSTIVDRTGHYVADTSIGDVEKGVKIPTWNTLAILAAAEFIDHPITGEFLSPEDLSDIAAGVVDPFDRKFRSRQATALDLLIPQWKRQKRAVEQESISDVLRQILDLGISIEELARSCDKMLPSRLAEIIKGDNPIDSEIASIAASELVIKPDGTRWSVRELIILAGLEVLPGDDDFVDCERGDIEEQIVDREHHNNNHNHIQR